MNQDFNYIKESEFERRSNMLDQFSDSETSSAITKGEFAEKFSKGHQIFTMEGINNFISKAVEGVETEEEKDEIVKGITEELKSLQKVVVADNGEYSSFFVKEDVVEKGESTEEVESETEEVEETETEESETESEEEVEEETEEEEESETED